jgi:nucleoside-diphosphate-sugar epimerase
MNDEFDLSAETVVLTGGAGILGSRFSHALARHGAKLAILDRELRTVSGKRMRSLRFWIASRPRRSASPPTCTIATAPTPSVSTSTSPSAPDWLRRERRSKKCSGAQPCS